MGTTRGYQTERKTHAEARFLACSPGSEDQVLADAGAKVWMVEQEGQEGCFELVS